MKTLPSAQLFKRAFSSRAKSPRVSVVQASQKTPPNYESFFPNDKFQYYPGASAIAEIALNSARSKLGCVEFDTYIYSRLIAYQGPDSLASTELQWARRAVQTPTRDVARRNPHWNCSHERKRVSAGTVRGSSHLPNTRLRQLSPPR